jgi:hypothetical protein
VPLSASGRRISSDQGAARLPSSGQPIRGSKDRFQVAKERIFGGKRMVTEQVAQFPQGTCERKGIFWLVPAKKRGLTRAQAESNPRQKQWDGLYRKSQMSPVKPEKGYRGRDGHC